MTHISKTEWNRRVAVDFTACQDERSQQPQPQPAVTEAEWVEYDLSRLKNLERRMQAIVDTTHELELAMFRARGWM